MSTCKGKTSRDKPCRRKVSDESEYCYAHKHKGPNGNIKKESTAQSKNEISDSRFHLTKRHYLTIGTLAGLVFGAIAVTYSLSNFFLVEPLQKKKTELVEKITDKNSELSSLGSELKSVKSQNQLLSLSLDKPTLTQPYPDASVIGKEVEFKWKYPRNNQYQGYVLEIKNITTKQPEKSYVVPNPDQLLMRIPILRLGAGEIIWRVIPGHIVNDITLVQGPISGFQRFYIYDSVIDRIKKTKTIRVGTTRTFEGKFNFADDKGNLMGLDIDFSKWIAKNLKSELLISENIKVEFVNAPFVELLGSLQKHDFDMVISHMTIAKYREDENIGVKFSFPYFLTEQIFISKQKVQDFPKSLSGRKIGVPKGTTNEKAAKYLSKIYGFTVHSNYHSSSQVYSAMERGELHFGLVDKIFATDDINSGRLFQFGPGLTETLRPFYREAYDRDADQFGIAVVDSGQDKDGLLPVLNRLIQSQEGRDKLKELVEKWFPVL